MQAQTALVTVSVLEVVDNAPAFRVKVQVDDRTAFWAPTYGMPMSDPDTPENRLALAALELVERASRI